MAMTLRTGADRRQPATTHLQLGATTRAVALDDEPGHALRRKLGDPPVITNTPGVGYRIAG